MGGFALGALALLVVALLFVLLPKRQTRPVGQDISASNVQWYRQREQELLESAHRKATQAGITALALRNGRWRWFWCWAQLACIGISVRRRIWRSPTRWQA